MVVAVLGCALACGGCGPAEVSHANESRTGTQGRILLIGLDGADWDLLDPLIGQGKLPNLAGLKERAAWGRLSTLQPILSPPIWTSIATGKTPDRHGITWFMSETADPTKRVPVKSTQRKCKAFRNILTESHRTVGVIGWWATYPAERVDGYIVADSLAYHNFGVSGRSLQSRLGKASPPSLLDRLDQWSAAPVEMKDAFCRLLPSAAGRFGELCANKPNVSDPVSHLLAILTTAETYARAAEEQVTTAPTDVAAVYFEGIDSVSHLFMKYAPPRLDGIEEDDFSRYHEVVERYCEFQDHLLGRLFALVDPEKDTVIVVSDHGFRVGSERPPVSEVEIDVATAHEWHAEDALFLVAGPEVAPGEVLHGSVLDITPTLLYLLGLPAASDMDGSVLLDAFKGVFIEENVPGVIPTYENLEGPVADAVSGEDDGAGALMEERLRALGYVSGDAAEETSPEMLLNQARAFLGKGKEDEAIGALESALARRPAFVPAHVLKGEIFIRQGRSVQAIESLRSAIRYGANGPEIHYWLVQQLLGVGNLMEAREAMSNALAVHPDGPRLLVLNAEVLSRAGDWEGALATVEKALALFPDDPSALYNQAVCLVNLGRKDEACSVYEHLLESDPDLPVVLNNLANLYEEKGDVDRAVVLLDRAAASAPDSAFEIFFNLGLLTLKRGDADKAIGCLEKAVRARPGSAEARMELATAYQSGGNENGALREWQALASLAGESHIPFVHISAILAGRGQKEAAVHALQRALAVDDEGTRRWVAEARLAPLTAVLAEIDTAGIAVDGGG